MADDAKHTPKENIRIQHVKSPNFVSEFAQNVTMHGPTAGGFYHLQFHRDVMELEYEDAVLHEHSGGAATYNIQLEPEATKHFREDVARLTVPAALLDDLAGLLERAQQRVDDEGQPSG